MRGMNDSSARALALHKRESKSAGRAKQITLARTPASPPGWERLATTKLTNHSQSIIRTSKLITVATPYELPSILQGEQDRMVIRNSNEEGKMKIDE